MDCFGKLKAEVSSDALSTPSRFVPRCLHFPLPSLGLCCQPLDCRQNYDVQRSAPCLLFCPHPGSPQVRSVPPTFCCINLAISTYYHCGVLFRLCQYEPISFLRFAPIVLLPSSLWLPSPASPHPNPPFFFCSQSVISSYHSLVAKYCQILGQRPPFGHCISFESRAEWLNPSTAAVGRVHGDAAPGPW